MEGFHADLNIYIKTENIIEKEDEKLFKYYIEERLYGRINKFIYDHIEGIAEEFYEDIRKKNI